MEPATMTERRRIRILIASPGLDGHDRGARVVARVLRDAGMEVIYLGIHRTTEEIVKAAIQEAVDFIGLSMLSGAHLILTEQILQKMDAYHADRMALIVGGTIPKKDINRLKEMGVALVFPTGAPLDTIVEHIRAYHATQPA
jgi:methylmalonyl-CoA mutase C-terminal domain/subunit